MPTTIEQLELEVQSSSTSAVAGIDALSASLSKLKNAVRGGVGLTSVANQVRNLDTALKSMDSSGADKIDKLASSLEKLKGLGSLKISSSIGNQLQNIGSAAASLTGVDFSAMEKLGTALQPLNNLNASGLKSIINALNKLPKLADTLDNMDMTKFTSQIQQLSTALAPLTNQLNAVTAAFNRLPTNIQRAITVTNRISQENNKAANSYMNLYAKIKMAMGVVRTGARVIASWITQSNQYIEDLNLFTASMGKYAEEAQNYAEAVSEALGIDPGEFMRNQGVFNTIISGFGVASDKAYLMSKNLTQLGYDISSFFNISFEDAMQKLQSGISGELEPLRRLGYDLSVARLQEEALALGIEKKVSAMTQAEKSQLRYYAIMTQVTTAQGDMARTLNAPANQLRVLQAQVTQCARALGNIFIPALNAVLPYAIALAKIVRMLANSIASLFGFKLPEVDYSGISAGASAVGDLADNAGDASDGLGKAGKAAKKLKNALLGIDELNVLSKDDSSSGSGSGSGAGIGGGDLGIDLPTYDFLGDVITSKVDEIVQMIKDAMWEITAVISGFLLAIGTILVVTGANIPLGLGLMAVGAVGLAASVMANWNGMSERLAKVLTLVTGVLGGFLLAIGAFLVFSGVNVPLGAGLMVAGAAALGTAAVINWKFLNGDLSNALSILTAIVSGALLAMGALFAFTGVDVPLGIALMAAGAVGMVTAIGLNWDSMSDPLRRTIGMLETIVGGALLTFGAILALTGVNVPLGVAMIAAGAVSVASAVALNWNSLTGDVQESVLSIVAIVSGALIGVGAILALTGVATGLGIAMIAAGAVGLAATVGLNWNSMPDNIRKVTTKILLIAGAASIAIGMILAFTGVATPLGVGLILAGAAALGTAVALNWDTLTNKLKGVTTKILAIAGAAALAIGIILCFTGVGIPLGVGLILSGAAALGTAVAINWETIKEKIKGVFTKIKSMAGSLGKLAIGLMLCLTGVGIPLGLALIADGVKDFATGKPVSWGSMVSGIKEALGNISDEWNKFKKKVKNSKPVQFLAEVKNNASEWWDNVKDWWSDKTKDGLSLETGVKLVKDGWSSVKNWIGNIPAVKQGVGLLKSGWSTVKNWIGNIPTVDQAVALAKSGWQTVKGWIGNIPGVSQAVSLAKSGWNSVREWVGNVPVVSQGISLLKSGWTTVKNWVGNIPTLSQAINLIKSGWQTVKGWIGNIPTLSQAISLIKSGWTTVKNWIGNIPVLSQGISLLKSGWTTVKNWIGNIPTLSQGISLLKSGWTTVKNWVGNIPTLSQAINLIKSGWQTVKGWIGNIPTLSQAISLIKSGWTTVKNWIGNIPVLSQGISLLKSGWTTVKNWIGNIPTLSQGISLLKSGWSTVKNWIGSLPVIAQGISLFKSGWTTIKNWIGSHTVGVGISLWKNGWSSISSFVGTSVSVGISLFKSGWTSIKKFFGLANGGIVGANGGVKMFASGGIITPNMWKAMPKYAGGTNRAHGSMFVAGESGAELVGHVNGTTEVLNRFQLASVMHSSIVSGMAQFSGYWQSMSRDIVTCANGIINAVVVSTAGINDNLVLASASGYDPYNSLAQTVYEDSKKSYDGAYSDDSWSRNMREFYHEYVEPILKEIATDTKRQADKKEQTIVKVGNRTINDAVTTQKEANGFSFTE